MTIITMSQTILPLALLLSLSTLDAFAPQHKASPSSSLKAQRQTDKKRRFLQQAHPIPPPKDDGPRKQSDGENRIKPPLQTSKSIEELEAILEKRWGTATSKKSDDGDFVMSFEEETEEPSRFHAHSEEKPRGAAVLRSRRVRDPWEKDDEEPARGEDSKNRWFNRDDAMLKRVRSNQERINNKKVKSQPREDDDTYQISIKNKDYYDQDDEGYETEGSIISPRPAGGRGKSAALDGGKSAALDGGIFSVRADNKRVKPMKEPATAVREKVDKKKPKRKEPQLQPMLDEDGNPMFLTLEQAERIVENILSSNPEGSNSLDSTGDIEWQDIGITNPQLLSNLQSAEMMCPLPLEVQIKACPPIIAGNDVLVSTHTGSGKTLAFLAPLAQNIMVNPSNSPLPKALIVAPGRELASQIVSVAQQLFRGTDLTVAMVIGGTAYMRNVEMLRSKKPDVVVGTPGRIAELIMGRSGDKGGKLKISNLQTIVLDEFDALLQYDAHKEPTNVIIDAINRQHGQSLQRILCSATASDMMSTKTGANVDNYLRPGYAHASIDETDLLVTSGVKGKTATSTRVSKTTIHGALHVPHQRLALDAVRRILNSDPVVQQALIFVDSPRRVEIVIEKLARMDIIAAPLHGGASSGKGDRAEVSRALREGYVGIVVATEMAARGLDAPFLTHVINLDLPTDASHFAHRSGRCGRGGRPGVSISITCNDRERGVPKRFAQELGITMHDVEARQGKIWIVKR